VKVDRKRFFFYWALALSISIALFHALGSWLLKNPLLEEPLVMTQNQTLVKPLNLRISNRYEIYLEVMKPQPGTKLTVLGEPWTRPDGSLTKSAVPIAIEWKVAAKEKLIATNSANPESEPTTHVWRSESVMRQIGSFDAGSGDYFFEARVLHDVPELRPYQTRIIVTLPSVKDHPSSPLQGIFFIGGIVVWEFLFPIAGLLWILALIEYRRLRKDKSEESIQ
jgi:hypothetical protein